MANIAKFERLVRADVQKRVSKNEQAPSWSDIKRLIKERDLFDEDTMQDPAFKARLKAAATNIAIEVVEGGAEKDVDDDRGVSSAREKKGRSPKGKRNTHDGSEDERPKKRIKKEINSSKKKAEVSEGESDPEPAKPAKQQQRTKSAKAKGKRKALEDSEEEEESIPIKSTSARKAHKRDHSSAAESEPNTTAKPPDSPEALDSSPNESKARVSLVDVAQLSDAELSVLENDSPVKVRKAKGDGKSKESKEKGKAVTKEKRGKAKPEIDTNTDSTEDQIKKLKALVTACGVRKKWAKEFEGIEDNPKRQIVRLKDILAELGMTGRMSMEKAKSIRAKRELAAELEDVVQFEARRGLAKGAERTKTRENVPKKAHIEDSDEEEVVSKMRNFPPRKKNVLAFLDDQSDEE